MKLEMDLDLRRVAKILVFIAIFIGIGYGLGMTTGPTVSGFTGMGYLTTADLNRDDIGASIILSRFCEGMGLQSSVYWQQDAQGNVYGQPICVQPQQ